MIYSVFVDNTVLSLTGFIFIMSIDIILIYCPAENVISHSDCINLDNNVEINVGMTGIHTCYMNSTIHIITKY